MEAHEYAQFLRKLGHRVIEADAMYWYDANRYFYLAAPPHRMYTPSADALHAAFAQLPCLGVRFAAPMDGPGKTSYQIVCDNAQYGLEGLSGNNRSKIRRGLKRCRIEPVPFATIASAGKQANADTTARQGRAGVLSAERWDRFFQVAAETPGFEGWGAWVDDVLAAFLVTVTFHDSVEFLLARSCSEHLNKYPNNALIFTVAEEMLVQRKAPMITFGLESLEPVGPLDEFKFGMGFRQDPLRQRVVFHPLLAPMLRQAPVRGVVAQVAERWGADSVFWRKARGLLRFAEEGGL